jgi:hypothetical protein
MKRRAVFVTSLVVLLMATMLAVSFAQVTVARAASANPVPGDPLTGNGNVSRTLLTYAELTTPQNPSAPVDDSGGFGLPANAAPPQFTFEGTLTLNNVDSSGSFTNIKNCRYCGTHLPPFTMDFVQNGSWLIPATQGLVITNDTQTGSTYNLIVGPGRVWFENSDTGSAGTFSRASLPVSLVDRNQNCVHNGEISFLFNATTVSYVRYQITTETCETDQFNMWGQLSATYTPHIVTNDLSLENAQANEVANQIPIKPLSALATDYPSAGINLATFGAGITPSAMTTYGVIYNGVNYVADVSSPNKGCQTRFGTYAFCYEERVPSYSTAKAAFTGLSLARLVTDYGSGVLNLNLKDYIPEMATNSNWNTAPVSFNDAANMATGNYNSELFESDENGLNTTHFLNAEPYAGSSGKMAYALNYPHHGNEQGYTWVYHSIDHFLLAQAETDYLQAQRGSSADLFNMMRDEVYIPMHLTAGTLTTSRTDNASQQGTNPTTGRPWGAYGLFWTVDDIAKLATLFENNGAYNGTQLVDRTQMLAAMQRLSSNTGVEAASADSGGNGDGTVSAGGWRYSSGLWAFPTTSQVPGCALRVPEMSGFGGITIAMMPNGATYYYVSDNNQFTWAGAIAELNKLSPMCGPSSSSVTSNVQTQTLGQPVTFSATVSAPTRSWAPTGTVQFKDNGTNLGSPVLLDATGKATFTTSSLSHGTHTITAVYYPDLTNNTGLAGAPWQSTLTSSCGSTATSCSVVSTTGLQVGDRIATGKTTLTDDVHTITALTPTSISWIGAFQSTSHGSGQPVWLQDTAGGGFAASTSSGYNEVIN